MSKNPTPKAGGGLPKAGGPIPFQKPNSALGKPKAPSLSGPSGAVQSEAPVDYSSRLPGESFKERPA